MAEIRVPTLGESVTEATIGKWFKKAGDAVAADEPLVELETDKVTIEVPAPAAGVLGEIAAKDGETVGVGALLGADQGRRRRRAGKAAAAPPGRPDQKTATTAPINAADEEPRAARREADAVAAAQRCAARAVGAQARGRKRHRCLDRSRLRQGRPRDQGRHAGRDRARRRAADAGCAAGRRRAGARARRPPTMPRAKSACR